MATAWLVLKNDIVALDLPLKHYLAECLQNGYLPWWINTWEMGFPLHSPLCWSLFNPLTLLFSLASPYHIYQLHAEWLLYVFMAGVGMYRLGRFALHWQPEAALYAGMVYMLSGFVLANAQFFGFIAAVAYIPFVLYYYLQLLQQPGAKNAIFLVFWGYCMLTGSYPAFMLVGCYVLLGALLYHLYGQYRSVSLAVFKQKLGIIAKWHALSLVLFVLVSLPLLYGLYQLMPYMSSGNAAPNGLTITSACSGYLHPFSLIGWLLPAFPALTSVSVADISMQGVYMGLPTLVWCIALAKRPKLFDTATFLLFLAALFCIAAALAQHLPVRAFLFNYVPLMQYFRHAGFFRYFALLFFLLAMGRYYPLLWQMTTPNSLKTTNNLTTAWQISLVLLASLLVFIMGHIYLYPLSVAYKMELLSRFLPHADGRYFWLMQGVWQFFLLLVLYKCYTKRKTKVLKIGLLLDIVAASWLNLPFTVISQYTTTQVVQKMPSTVGFPMQAAAPSSTPSTLTDHKGNKWYNINVFAKQVSVQPSYTGSLTLYPFNRWSASALYPQTANNPIAYLSHDYRPLSQLNKTDTCQINTKTVFLPDSQYTKLSLLSNSALFVGDTVRLLSIKPNQIEVFVHSGAPQMLCLLQNNYPNWKAYYNRQLIPIETINYTFMGINIPAGTGTVKWVYEPTTIKQLALLSLAVWAIMALILALDWVQPAKIEN